MIKVYVRAIVPTENSYVLMSDQDRDGKEMWDLPGGELEPGVDVKQLLRRLVLERTGYRIGDVRFFEITCKVRPRGRGQNPATILDFIFTSQLEDALRQPAEKQTDHLRFEKFEWLESEGRFRENKVMALLGRYHRHAQRGEESRLQVDTGASTATSSNIAP